MASMARERLEDKHGPHARRCLISRPVDSRQNGLVMVLHGAGATAAWMFQEVGLEEWAGKRGIVLAFPEATRARMDKPPHVLDNTPCWEDGSNRRMPRSAEGADDVKWLGGLISKLACGGMGPVVLAGFSNGASMALRLAASEVGPLAGLLAIGGYPRAEMPGFISPVKTFFLHGRLDPIVPPAGGWVKTPWQPEGYAIPSMHEAVANWARLMGVGKSTAIHNHEMEQTAYHDDAGNEWVRWMMLENLGHHWPGGKGQWESQSMGPRLESSPIDVRSLLEELLALEALGGSLPSGS
jgi:polyhydroxybutyrate depolymerase